MQETVYPRYTLFERLVLGIWHTVELPYHAVRTLAKKIRKHFELLYLEDIKEGSRQQM